MSCCAALAVALTAAEARTAAVRIDVRAAPLSSALAELAREAGVDLLFDETLVRNLRAGAVRGTLSVGETLSVLLAGTGIGYRVTPDGVFVLFALPARARGAVGEADGAIAEILVVGRRTQNADIRRTENDIQPYKVASRRDLSLAQHDGVDQFMRGRVPANAQIVAPSQDVARVPGATRSAIDLRGLGAMRTLVLVDGRRLPNLPSGSSDFDQADLNGIPLTAIERIETLTSTAGGIYGPSAIGGVVNVILRRDYRGADVTVTSGIADRGDAARVRLETRVGFTPDGGDTDVMLFAAYATSRPLYAGQRDYGVRSRRRQFENDPAAYLGRRPVSNSIAVFSVTGEPLTLDPAFGGTALSTNTTFLPLNFTGSDVDRTAALVANSGMVVIDLPPDHAGELTYLVSNPRIVSGLFNIRHRFSDRLEGYVDGIYSSNHGKTVMPNTPFSGPTQTNAPSNPFAQPVYFRFPAVDFFAGGDNKVELSRLSAGIILALPSGWQATADYSLGRAGVVLKSRGVVGNGEFFNAQLTGQPRPGGLPALSPLGGFAELRTATAAYSAPQGVRARLTNRFSDASLRVSGPLVPLAGGPLTLTVLGESRGEHVPAAEILLTLGPDLVTFATPRRTEAVWSGYAELRAPLLPSGAEMSVLSGLEVQFAVRHDRVRTRFPDDATPAFPSNDELITVRRGATVFTGGARFFPATWLMLRSSLATGELPPSLSQLQSTERLVTTFDDTTEDPRRGGRPASLDGPYVVVGRGSHRIRQEHGRTVSIGAVLNPAGRDGPRVSVDYARIDSRREVITFPLSPAALLAAEAIYPDRVVRAALTPADASLGFTAGRVILLDTGAINAGRTIVESVDVQLDWTLPPMRVGDLRAYGSATWQPSFRRRVSPEAPWVERIGYYDGPLAWRGNLGLQWTRGATTVDVNLQYYDSYRVSTSGTDSAAVALNAQMLRYQGARRIPAQAYVDLVARRRFELGDGAGPFRVVEARFGVQNLLDHRPPIVAEAENVGYSPYGDPRRRRLELRLSAGF